MKLVTFLLSLLLFSGAVGAQVEADKLRPKKWMPIVFYKIPGGKMYYDENSRVLKQSVNGQDFNGITFLLSLDTPQEVTIGKKTVKAKSIEKIIVVQCKTGMAASVFDLYYDIDTPPREKDPVAGKAYKSQAEAAFRLDEKSPIFTTACPVFI